MAHTIAAMCSAYPLVHDRIARRATWQRAKRLPHRALQSSFKSNIGSDIQGKCGGTIAGAFTLAPAVSPRRHIARAASTSASSSPDGRRQSRWDPLLANSDVGCPVPPEQQPVNEYSDLAEALFFAWGTMGPFNLSMRLGSIWLFFTLFVGFPIASASFDPFKQALQCVLSAFAGGLIPVSLATLRIYLGWQYVGARLSSATVEYEETGWYDGQIWVKTPELLARDRLLASYRVKPVLNKLKNVLLGLGSSLVVLTGLVAVLPPSYVPKPEPSPYPFGGMEVDGTMRGYNQGGPGAAYRPEAVQEYEGEEFEDSATMQAFLKFHGAPQLDDVALLTSSSHAGTAGLVAASNTVLPGYGFEFLSSITQDRWFEAETEENQLFSSSEARQVGKEIRGLADVTIVGARQEVVGNSEDTMRGVEGDTEELELLGRGVTSRSSGDVTISGHLGVGSGGELVMIAD